MRWEKASNETGEEGNGTISFGSRKGNIGGGIRWGNQPKLRTYANAIRERVTL